MASSHRPRVIRCAGVKVRATDVGASARHQPLLPQKSDGVLDAISERRRGELELALRFAGPEHILAGSDYPHQIGSPESMLRSIRSLGLSGGQEAKILGDNAYGLLRL